MYYPNCIDYTKISNKYYKFYDIDVVERNCIYPFTYKNTNDINYYFGDNNQKNSDNIINNEENKNKIDINDFVRLPDFENLVLDANGLPFIPLDR